jgi:diguanylate cyclase (GGDEF)-like protein
MMKASTAVTFLAAALALVACASRRTPGVHCGLPNLIVVLMGGASLLEYAVGVDLWIDHLFADPEALALGNPPGRMSQMSALAFVLLGTQGLLVSHQKCPRLSHALAAALMSVGTLSLAIAGYRYQIGAIRLVPVAAPTAMLILLGTLGWLMLQPPMGIMRVAFSSSPGGVLLRRAALPALLMPLAVALVVRAGEQALGWSHEEVIATIAYLSGLGAITMVMAMAWLLHNLDNQRRESEQFHNAAYTDALTRLVNRRGFDEALERLLQGHRQTDRGFTLLMLDLDHFKHYNDDFGHLAGDRALQITSEILASELRPQDLATRFGGEEFAVLLPETGAAGARRAAQRLHGAFHARAWPHRAVTASIGIAGVHPGDTPESLIARADSALYAAKSAGRDRACEVQATALGSMP